MPSMDVFQTSGAFTMRSLTAAINVPDYTAGQVTASGIFSEAGLNTTKVSLERLAPSVGTVASTPRGAAPIQRDSDVRSMYDLNMVRVAIQDVVYADELLNVRAFGSEDGVKALAAEVQMRMDNMAASIAATHEWMRVTALKGDTLDGDGTTSLIDSSDVFSIADQASHEIDTDSTTNGEVRGQIAAAIRKIEAGLKGRNYTGLTCYCDGTFFDNLVGNVDVRDTFVYSEGQSLRDRTAGRSIFMGGVNFVEYRNQSGRVPFAAGKGVIVPEGVDNLFLSRFGPADFSSSIGGVGLPMYARTFPDVQGDRFQTLEVQSNVLHVNTDPGCVLLVDDGA